MRILLLMKRSWLLFFLFPTFRIQEDALLIKPFQKPKQGSVVHRQFATEECDRYLLYIAFLRHFTLNGKVIFTGLCLLLTGKKQEKEDFTWYLWMLYPSVSSLKMGHRLSIMVKYWDFSVITLGDTAAPDTSHSSEELLFAVKIKVNWKSFKEAMYEVFIHEGTYFLSK